MKITEIWRNDGWWSNLYIVLDNKYRVEVRLFNEGTSDILLETVESNDDMIIQIDDTSCINIDSNIIGREYNLPNNLVRLENMIYSCQYPNYDEVSRSLKEVIGLVKQGNMNLFQIDEYEVKKNNATQMFKKYPDIERFVNDVFLLAHEVVMGMIDKNNEEEQGDGK